ncbi:MAG: pullulanase [Gemmatimonadetes bacterium]|nr:pullulanase [Gemmatimonadota bacterium]NNK63970.1 pullulanase [Gemmatimonadota bacterium]
MTVPYLEAEIHGPSAILLTLEDAPRPTVSEVRLTDGRGNPLAVSALVPRTEAQSLLVPEVPVDPYRVHYVELPGLDLRALVRRDPLFRTLYSSKPLGAVVADDGSETTFRVFAPRARALRLHLYGPDGRTSPDPQQVVALQRDEQGVWEVALTGDLHRVWYDFTVHGPDDPGNGFFETHPVHISDPYARVNDDGLGRSRVWRVDDPPPPVAGGRPAMEDVVAYEVHVQDFTDLLPVDEAEAGTFPAMTRSGLVNAAGEPVGFDHLVELGINVVHLMPVQEYLHYPDAEWRAAFADDDFAREMAIDRENYNWGYRTTHAFAVESRYRPHDSEPGTERRAFKELVAAFHERGIAVVIDLVPNHTGENVDDRDLLLHFNALDRAYYYRTNDDLEHIGPFGNEVKTEDRPMVQRWLLDQMQHWVDDLGVDGFRIDLAGQIDRQTLAWVRAELDPSVIIYGEPWIPPSDPGVRHSPDWSWYKSDAPITFFQDETRNALQGSPFDIRQRGWAGGDGSARDGAVRALANAYYEESHSTRGISYLDIHDNWALADRYALGDDHDGRAGVDVAAVRRAAGLLLTSVGPVVLHGGTEILRSKGLAPRETFTRETATGTIYFNGREDTYNLRAPNRFLWDALAPGTDAASMRDWWQGLIALRSSEHGAVFRVDRVPEDHYRFFLPPDDRLLGYRVGDRVLVVANNGTEDSEIDVELDDGSWLKVADEGRIDLAGVPGADARLEGAEADATSIPAPAGCFRIWIREADDE